MCEQTKKLINCSRYAKRGISSASKVFLDALAGFRPIAFYSFLRIDAEVRALSRPEVDVPQVSLGSNLVLVATTSSDPQWMNWVVL